MTTSEEIRQAARAKTGVRVNAVRRRSPPRAPRHRPPRRGRLQRRHVSETRASAARHLERACRQPFTKTVPIGVGATREFIAEVGALAGIDVTDLLAEGAGRMPWWSRFGRFELPHRQAGLSSSATGPTPIAAARIAAEELGFEVVGPAPIPASSPARCATWPAGSASRRSSPTTTRGWRTRSSAPPAPSSCSSRRWIGRHIAKRLGIACAVISATVHVQDLPGPLLAADGLRGSERHLRHLRPLRW